MAISAGPTTLGINFPGIRTDCWVCVCVGGGDIVKVLASEHHWIRPKEPWLNSVLCTTFPQTASEQTVLFSS